MPAWTFAPPPLSRALSAGCAALHFLSHHRTQRPDPARIARGRWATAFMAATIAWRFAPGTNSPRGPNALNPREELTAPRLAELARLDDMAFRALFRKSPVKRIGRDRFVSNVLIAIGNSGDRSGGGSAALLGDPSALVRGAAVWALGRLLPREEFISLPQRTETTGRAGGMGRYFFLSGGFGGRLLRATSSAARLRRAASAVSPAASSASAA